MSRIAFFSLPTAGHVYPTLAVVSELAAAGHQVTYLTTTAFADVVRAAGADVVVYDAQWNPEAEGDPDEAERKAAEFPLELVRQALVPIPVAEAHFGAEPPDVVVYDGHFGLTMRTLARYWGAPGVQLWPTFASSTSFSLLAELAQHAPPSAPLPAEKHAEMTALLQEFLDAHGASDVPFHELDPPETDDLYVVFLTREFQILGDTFPDDYAFVGPSLYTRGFQGDWTPPSDDPVVLISMGTTGFTTEEFYRGCIEAFIGVPWHVVISTGHHLRLDDSVELPPNVEVHAAVPQLEVLRHARMFVSHGGMGSTMESLAHGVPLVFTPHTAEQRVIADRATGLALGRTADAGTPSPAELRDLVVETDADPKVRESVRRMAENVARAGGARAAAERIGALLDADRPEHP